MNLRMWLARLAGARPDILAKTPGDLAKHATMGGVLISTSAVAGLSAFFALNSVLDLSWPICVVVGFGWAVLILNLDRMLVVSMSGAGSLRRNLATALPRLVLAIVLGTVISTPLVLRVFEQEINAELTTMKAENVQHSKDALNKTYDDIAKLEAAEKGLQDVISGKTTRAVSDDPDVKAAQAAFDSANRAYDEAEKSAQCELDGTCGTKRPGDGDAYRQKQVAADTARGARDEAKRKLDDLSAKAAGSIQNGSASDVEAAKAKLPGVQRDLATQRELRRTAEDEATQAQDHNSGLLARLEALGRITDGHPVGWTAHLMLFLLFLCIEVLPVLTKILAGLGPPTTYDRLLAQQDRQIEDADRLRADGDRQLLEERENARVTHEREQLELQTEAGRTATEELVRQQTQIALKAIGVWAELAKLRSDEELDRWYRANVGKVGGHAVPPPSPSEQTMPIPVLFHNGHPRNGHAVPAVHQN
ncbi:DUF4407 domain-containing protein [Amycolatopsis sp. NBC_00348]|uniref:DUF4407 domain-containing protein n=1 Tax=Amycolatopsis sp. NBC_00348 TaxID=2975956 RepID=UPI002E25531C